LKNERAHGVGPPRYQGDPDRGPRRSRRHWARRAGDRGAVPRAHARPDRAQIDGHHTVEDIGITLGQAVAQALGDKRGIRRYGHAYVPLDEALSRVVIDLSGRPGMIWRVEFPRARVGDFDTELFHEFFQGFVNHAQVTLHVDALRGQNAHHIAETVFKAFARALRMAVEPDPRMTGVTPSTKGQL
jgi:imidazoleglycerol-phosphate dehydratase